jgi:hypothetical protein
MKRLNTLAIALLALAVPVSAQQTTTASGGTGQGQGQGRGSAQAATVSAGQGRGFTRDAQATNVRLDITINDQSAGGPPVRKLISMLIADQGAGRVRSQGNLTQEFVAPGLTTPDGKPLVQIRPVMEVTLNVDAQIDMLANDRIRAGITLEYSPGSADPLPAGSPVTRSPLNQSVTVILQNGKSLMITQAADPLSDRKITVEVLATILR